MHLSFQTLCRPASEWLMQTLRMHPREGRVLAWSWLYVFSLFVAYSVLRPIRDELGVAGGVENLPWLFTGTLVAMLAVNPLFALATKRWPRERFIPVAYRFFIAHLVVFVLLLWYAAPEQEVWIGRAFFIWASVFNLFVVSVFWSFVVDLFDADQGKRLFGYLAAGATMGGIAGAGLTVLLVEAIGHTWLLLVSVALLEVAVFASRRMGRLGTSFRKGDAGEDPDAPLQGGVFAGMTRTLRSPYLSGIAVFILLYSVTSTFLYFQQATIAADAFSDRGERTAFFATIDVWVNVITLVLQLFLTGRLMSRLGLALTLCALPLFSMAGFAMLAAAPSVGVFVVVQVLRRVSNFALARPSREVLFTVVPREDRYKAKNFIDTVVYRTGDQAGGWAYAGLAALGVGVTGIAVLAVPLSGLWLALSWWLGRHEETSAGKVREAVSRSPKTLLARGLT